MDGTQSSNRVVRVSSAESTARSDADAKISRVKPLSWGTVRAELNEREGSGRSQTASHASSNGQKVGRRGESNDPLSASNGGSNHRPAKRPRTAETAAAQPSIRDHFQATSKDRIQLAEAPSETTNATLKEISIPRYFYLDRSTTSAKFLRDTRRRTRYETEIAWRDQHHILTLCTDMSSEEQIHVYNMQHQYPRASIPLLQSHLVLCIRAGNAQLARRTAYEFMNVDAAAFFQSLSAIILAEAVPNSQYPVIVWLLCATKKGFRVPYKMQEWVIGLVGALANAYFRDDTQTASPPSQSVTLVSTAIARLPNSKRDLIYSLQLCRQFQPLSAHRDMIDILTERWLHRMHTDPLDSAYSRAQYAVSNMALDNLHLGVETWDVTAVLPHCSSIVDLLRLHLTAKDQARWKDDQVLKEAIIAGCAVNKRPPISSLRAGAPKKEVKLSEEAEAVRNKYRKEIARLQARILKELLKKPEPELA
ncbi:uncharacterized protein EV422DRAFT_285022 [Fimicolochytrium jonesii]|uniref:uncharacterized protein n=1 Tax=Fimicolochytrium jonesii TaxID=1396493 RepID=UPI0022FDBDE2|nr:uncharacterized protein EV422DRAFT_285022 [Fimicolochytrium jonesii]KAI8816474.1 hypothetical protein EV422DRAFT_285022 [Fimicolochytrium jonesii]